MGESNAVAIEMWLLDRLLANPRNYRIHADAQIAALRASLRRHGQQKPVVIRPAGMILAGHGIVLAAQAEGWDRVAVHVYDGADPNAYLIDDNETVRLAGQDETLLAQLLRERLDAGTLDSSGWAEQDIRLLIERLEADEKGTGEDPGPEEPPAHPISRPGDTWLLDGHRLRCGDCTDPDDVDALFHEQRAGCCVTSPPYAEQRKAEYGGIPADQYPAWFLTVARQVWRILDPAGSFFLNIKEHVEDGQRSLYVMRLVIAMAEAGWHYIDQLIWQKVGLPGEHKPRLRNDFEPIFFFARSETINWMVQTVGLDPGWVEEFDPSLVDCYENIFQFAKDTHIQFRPRAVGHHSDSVPQYRTGNLGVNPITGNISLAKHLAPGIARPGNVQSFMINQEALAHPAMFPVALPTFFIRLTTEEGGLVYEPFSGSGTTMIAAQRIGRRCCAMEILPPYCDVAIVRWQEMTGKTARLEGGGAFGEVGTERENLP